MPPSNIISALKKSPEPVLDNTITGFAKANPADKSSFFFSAGKTCINWQTVKVAEVSSYRRLGSEPCNDGRYYHVVQISFKSEATVIALTRR